VSGQHRLDGRLVQAFLDKIFCGSNRCLVANILVVDDEPSVLASVEQALRTDGHKVNSAKDGSEAILLFQKEPADLVITDIFMPHQDGIQLIVYFRKQFPNLPIIAITGNPKGNTLDMARKLGAAAVLPKPFAVEELLNAVRAALPKGPHPSES
jgi:DNA-binding response OmpR family regulator